MNDTTDRLTEPVPLPRSLQDATITALPPTAYYIPNFITSAEEAFLLHKISTAPLPHWAYLSHRRLQTYPSPLTPTTHTLLSSPLPIWLTDPILARLAALGVFDRTPHGAPNHVLVNEYKPGQGIMPHEDGDAYAPCVATVSLGAVGVLDVYAKGNLTGGGGGRGGDGEGGKGVDGVKQREEKPRWRIVQERGSLLVTGGELYTGYLHGIREALVDEGLREEGVVNWGLLGDKAQFESGRCVRGTRVSLTFRDVLRVKRVAGGLGFLGKR